MMLIILHGYLVFPFEPHVVGALKKEKPKYVFIIKPAVACVHLDSDSISFALYFSNITQLCVSGLYIGLSTLILWV